jgi:hypothetical protein
MAWLGIWLALFTPPPTPWQELHLPWPGVPRVACTYRDLLYVGGSFSVPGYAEPVGLLVRTREGRWEVAGGGVRGVVRVLLVHEEKLYLGGAFDRVGALAARNVACFDGQRWEALGEGLDGEVRALVIHQGGLIAAGGFERSGIRIVRRVARWDGQRWMPIGEGVDDWVYALASYRDRWLVAGGAFRRAGSSETGGLAVWDGFLWNRLDGSRPDGAVYTLYVSGDTLWVGGAFQRVHPRVSSPGVARWVFGRGWEAVGEGLQGPVYALAAEAPWYLAAGAFSRSGSRSLSGLARWVPDTGWVPWGEAGADGPVYALARLPAGWVVVGAFTHLDGRRIDRIALFSLRLRAEPDTVVLTGPPGGMARARVHLYGPTGERARVVRIQAELSGLRWTFAEEENSGLSLLLWLERMPSEPLEGRLRLWGEEGADPVEIRLRLKPELPRLQLEVDSLYLEAPYRGAALRTIRVRNPGPHPVRLSGLTASHPWLRADMEQFDLGPGDVSTLVLQALIGGLPPGLHRGEVSLQAEGLTVARIPVQVRVRAPRIELDPPELRLEVASGENRLVVLRLHNAGDWDLIVTRLESKAPWLRLEGGAMTLEPGQTRPIRLLIEPGALAPGSYQTTLRIIHNDQSRNPLEVPVQIFLRR